MSEFKIPKIIHYCWFGRNPKSELITRCIKSWKKYMPDYEIREWNETNYDINKATFLKEAYFAKKWAFVSDYARFDIIYNFGGIYFDTDVELLKPIPEEIINQNCFTGFESAGKINPGLVYADVRQGNMTKKFLDAYCKMSFLKNGKPTYTTVNTVVTDILKPYGLIQNNTFQVVKNIAIYPSSVFCGFDQDVKELDIREDTISVHHYAGTWTNKSKKQILRNWLKKVFGVNGYRRILNIYRRVRRRRDPHS